MARPASNDEFTEYVTWLVQSEGKSPATAKQYASTLRALVRARPEMVIRQADFVSYFDETRRLAPLKYVVVRSAWPSYARFKQQRGVTIPDFDKKIQTHEPITVPKDVIDAVRALHYHRVGIRVLVTLTWAHVDIRPLENYIALPTAIILRPPKYKHALEAPSAPMKVLFDYARGDRPRPTTSTPLIPYLPGGATPVPLSLLQENINEYEEMSHEEFRAYIRSISPPRKEVITSADYQPPNLKDLFRKAREDHQATLDAQSYGDPNDVDDEAAMDAREADRKASLASIMGFDPNAD